MLRATARRSAVLLAALLALLGAASVASAATYSITVQTSAPSYSGGTAISVSGVVSPAPGTGSAIILMIKNSAGSVADVDEVFPDPTTGAYNDTFHPGGNAAWTTGLFTVNATWGGSGGTATQVATFSYTAAATSTTGTTSVTQTNAPEFPASALPLVALLVLAAVAAISRRASPAPSAQGLIK